MRTKSLFRLTFACAFGLGVAGGGPASADGAPYDPALGDQACEIVTPRMVAASLDVAPDALQQTDLSGSICSYRMEGDGDVLEVSVMVNAFQTEEAAAEFFRDFTRDVSPEEMAERLRVLGVEEDDHSGLADSAISASLQDGIRFEDVDGVADQARFNASEGSLHLQQGNLQINLSAFHGPDAMLPDRITPETIAAAVSDWKTETMDRRKEQAMELAKAMVNAL